MDCYYEWRKHIRALLLKNYFHLLHLILAWNHKGWDSAGSFSVLRGCSSSDFHWSQIFAESWCWGWCLMGSHQSCLTQFLNTGHRVFSCSNTETKPTTGFGDEEGRSDSITVSEKWLLRMQPLSGWGTDSCQVSCHLKTGPVRVRPQAGQPKSNYCSGRCFFLVVFPI